MSNSYVQIKDGSGQGVDVASFLTAGGRVAVGHVPLANGEPVTAANPLQVAVPGGIPTIPAGSTGFDYSASGVTTPAGTLLLTIPVNDDRLSVEVQNQSAADVTLIRDDGANGQRSAIVLATGGAVGAAGGGWSSATFRGRIRVYGPANSRVAAMED